MKKFAFIFISLLLSFELSSQINKYGTPLIKNYSTQLTQGAEYNWAITKDKTGVLYFGNDNKGIIRYDGHSWSSIPVPNGIVRTLGVDNSGVIYVGGSYEFGYIEPMGSGTYKYISLSQRLKKSSSGKKSDISVIHNSSDKIDSAAAQSKKKITTNDVQIGEIYSMVVTDTAVYFSSLESLFKYNIEKDSVEFINLRAEGLKQVVRIAKVGNRILLADNLTGLSELKNNKVVKLPGGDFFKMKRCMVMMPFSDSRLYIGTLVDGVFLYDYTTGKTSADLIDPKVNEKLKEANIYTATDKPSGERILGTIHDGVFMFSREGKFLGHWTREWTNMQDNTISALYIGPDDSSELWMSTAGYISKVYLNLPYTEISPKQGYDGVVNNVSEFNGHIFISTDLGLFRSKLNPDGITVFELFGNVNSQVFALTNTSDIIEKSLLVGSNQGLYRVLKNDKIEKFNDILKYKSYADKTEYSYYVRSIFQSRFNPQRFYIGLQQRGIVAIEYRDKLWQFIRSIKTGIQGYVYNMIENDKGDLFIYSANPVGIYCLKLNDTIPKEFTRKDGLPDIIINGISKIGIEIVLTSVKGLYRFNPESSMWVPFNELLKGSTDNILCKDIILDKDGDFWMSVSGDRIYEMLFREEDGNFMSIRGLLNIIPNLDRNDLKYFDSKYWMAKSKSVYIIDKDRLLKAPKSDISTVLTKITIGRDSVLMAGSFFKTLSNGKNIPVNTNKGGNIPLIKFSFNSISFFWSLPFYVDEESSKFSYKLDGFDKDWSKWESVYYKDYTNLSYGKYTFRVKARTSTEIESGEAVFEFYILKPWYLKTIMIILYAIAVVFIIIAIIMAYTRKLKNENIRLEGIVAERTAVVVKQKEELESSIHYASRIQMALLPSEAILSENLKNYFILFKPRDIVSGDFYWMTKKNNRLYVVAADCTGHGVPGAFMSLLGMSFLDEIIDKEAAPRADHVLSELRLHVTESLKQVGGDDEAKDGMDMALLVVDFNTSRIEFSGAYNPCFRVRKMTEDETRNFHDENNEMADGSIADGKYILETIYASKMPIGISSRMKEEFVFFDWTLERGISYYLFSDGYIDQFGGPNGRKFMKKNFKRLILEIQDYPMTKQKEILEQNLKSWMGQSPQIDDILVMGIRTD